MTGKRKLPALQLYAGDWFKDVQLRQCSEATRGIWIDCLLLMHADDRSGRLVGTIESLARATGSTPANFEAALRELERSGAADVTQRHDEVTLENRRMRRDWRERRGAAARQRRRRAGGQGDLLDDGDVTSESRPDLSSSASTVTEDDEQGQHEAGRIAAYRGDFGSNAEARRNGRRGPPISETERADRDLVEHLQRGGRRRR